MLSEDDISITLFLIITHDSVDIYKQFQLTVRTISVIHQISIVSCSVCTSTVSVMSSDIDDNFLLLEDRERI